MIFIDGTSSLTGSGAGIILENEEGILVEVSLALSFPTSNNQTEYETFLTSLRLAGDLGAEEVKIFTDSQLVASQVRGEYQVKNDQLAEYWALVQEAKRKFKSVDVQHVPREHNARADVLSKLASTKRNGGNKSVIQEILPRPRTQHPSSTLEVLSIEDNDCWMTPVHDYLTKGKIPDDPKKAVVVRQRACLYVLVKGKLYIRRFSIPLLKCIDRSRVERVLLEIHEGIDSQHLDGISLARKALQAGYYWPTMWHDARERVKKCDKCQ